MDWHQLWTIISLPDNIPILGLMVVIPFYTWYAFRQAFANDRLIEQLEADPDMAKTASPQDPALERRLGRARFMFGPTCCGSSFWRRSS